jgi:hypothetical protein
MFQIACNIDRADRINRAVFGVIIILAALAGMGKVFFIILGLVMLVEGIVGWCGIPGLLKRLRILR